MAPPRAPITKFGLIGRFFGNTVSEAAAFAAGVALGPVLGPPVEIIRQRTWSKFPHHIPDVSLLASGVAQGQVPAADAKAWARLQGYDDAPWNALVAIADSGPGAGYAFEARRRGLLTDAEFRTALKREAIEDQWIEPLVKLLRRLLSPAELANAVVQGFRDIDSATADAVLQGYTAADFQTMVDTTGLPPGPETLQEWARRGIIDQSALAQGIREGHTKVKYIDEYVASLKRVLSATTYVEGHLRDWISEPQMLAGGALTGYDAAAMDLLYKVHGRPATTHQVHIGYQRGGRLPGVGNDERATFSKAVRQSNIRPEWEELLWAQRYTYPSAFVLRALTQAGDLTQAETETILLYSGWEPTLAKSVSLKWAGGTTAKGKAETASELADEYVLGFINQAEYRAALATLGYTGHNLDLEVLHAEVAAIKAARTAATTKLRNAYEKGDIDQAAFTQRLGALGMQQASIDREVQYANVVLGR